MYKNWEIRVWGVRGNSSTPFREFMEYGGNTTCISVRRENHMVVFDAGTGLATLGREWNSQKDIRLDILISHLHIDHVIGLFGFQPFLDSDIEICLHGAACLEQRLRNLLSSPWWPLGFQDFKARIYFHEIQPGTSFQLDSFTISTMKGNHPDGSILYRLDGDKKRLVYALDCEVDEETAAGLSDFAEGSDLIIWDANFTTDDSKKGWGHSTWQQGLKIGHESKAERVLMTHFNQGYTDEFLQGQEKIACEDDICLFAKEGMEIIL